MTTVRQLLCDSPLDRLDTDVLLALILNKPKEFLYTHPEYQLTWWQVWQFKKLSKKRLADWPIAYLTGQKEFFGLNFFVNKNVLVPRPETEILVEESLKIIKDKNLTVADIGTGSGCIAITIAKHRPSNFIYATDISRPALKVAKKNAATHNVAIKFHHGHLLKPLKRKKIDVLLANLPYLWQAWRHPSIKQEPKTALFADEWGLKLYRQLLRQLNKYHHQPQYILCEFDPRQTADIKKLFAKHLPSYSLEIKKDLAGHDRLIVAHK